MFNDLVEELTKRITSSENRSRARSEAAQVYITMPLELHGRQSVAWYSENQRYRDPLLTFKQMMALLRSANEMQQPMS